MIAEKITDFQHRIAELIASSGLSQSAIAADFGIAKQTLSAWVTGQNSPRAPIIYALSYYFDVSAPWLMGFDVPRGNSAGLSADEKKLLESYRSLSTRGKEYLQLQAEFARNCLKEE